MTKRSGLCCLPLLAGLLLAPLMQAAAPLTATSAIHTKPDISSPVVSYLKAGTTPTPASEAMADTPAGWVAVELPGPFEVYVQNKEIGKSLDIRPGAPLHLQPKLESGVLTTMVKGDKVEITGLRGKWTQIKLDKKLVGYVRLAGLPTPAIATTPTPVNAVPAAPSASTTSPAPAAQAPVAPPPVPPVAYGVAPGGQAAPMVDLGDGGASTLPRLFQGKFASTRRPFAPRRPYDYQLNDEAGVRYAYVDLSKLLITESIEKYLERTVVVFGMAQKTQPNGDIVIIAESIQAR